MPNLTLKFKNTTLEDYRLLQGQAITIGRKQTNDVIIENLAVSGYHAKIDSVADGFVLVDLQSKNGSFVNEELINSHWLKNGDVINIGKHSLVFSYSENEEQPDDGLEEVQETMVIDTSQHRNMMKKINSKVSAPHPRGNRNEKVGILNYLAGGKGKIKLEGKITKLGKHPASDIVVKGLLIGRTSLTISKRPDGFYLSYVGGMSKPKLNDKVVKRSEILKDLDIIEIGSTKLQFFIIKPNQRKKKMI